MPDRSQQRCRTYETSIVNYYADIGIPLWPLNAVGVPAAGGRRAESQARKCAPSHLGLIPLMFSRSVKYSELVHGHVFVGPYARKV